MSPRLRVHGTLLGIATGIVATGLAVPFVLGSEPSSPSGVVAGAPSVVERPAGDEQHRRPATEATAGDAPGAAGSDGVRAGAGASAAETVSAPASVPAGERRATDTGVTADTVTLGFPLYDLGGAGRLGLSIDGLDTEAQRAVLQSLVDHVNDEGGINGRRIQPVYQPLEVLSPDSAHAACLALTEDAKSFAVLGDLIYPSASQCVTSHETILVTNSASITDESFAGAGSLLYGMFPRASRMMANFADKLDRLGQLDGKKVGILGDKGFDPTGSTMAALVAAVRSGGGTVVRATNLSEDDSVGSSQIPVEVNQMRSGGAEVILFISSFLYATQFAQQADSQGWVPRYFASDWGGLYVSNVNENMPDSYDGTLVVTTTRDSDSAFVPDPPQAAQCREIYEERTGKKLSSGDHDYALVQCDLLFSFVTAARLAGLELTRASAGASMQQMGPFAWSFWGGGAFGPGKFDMADLVQVDRWSRDCKCYKPHQPFEPSAH